MTVITWTENGETSYVPVSQVVLIDRSGDEYEYEKYLLKANDMRIAINQEDFGRILNAMKSGEDLGMIMISTGQVYL